MPIRRTVDDAYFLTKDAFKPKADNPAELDHWKVSAKAVLAGLAFEDDCDGFALSAGSVLKKLGVPEECIHLKVCKVPGEGMHLVCAVDYNDDTLILDNLMTQVWSWQLIDYDWIYTMCMAEKVWRKDISNV